MGFGHPRIRSSVVRCVALGESLTSLSLSFIVLTALQASGLSTESWGDRLYKSAQREAVPAGQDFSREGGSYPFERSRKPGTEGFADQTGSGAIADQGAFLLGHDFVRHSWGGRSGWTRPFGA